MSRTKNVKTRATTKRSSDHGLRLVTPPRASAHDPADGPSFVELIRVSTKGQANDDTPEMQRRALDLLAERRPGERMARIEVQVSGAAKMRDRPDLLELERLSKLRAYKELRVYDLDRLTRSDDMRERAAVYGMVADAGAVIVDVSGRVIDPQDESGQSEMDYLFRTYFAAHERKRI